MAKTNYPKVGDHTPSARAQRETHWRRLIQRWKASGIAKSEFCAREAVSVASFHWWIQNLGRRKRPRQRVQSAKTKSGRKPIPKFIPVQVAKPASTADPGVELVVARQIIRVAPGFHPETLRRVVAVLEGRPC